jgi:hypothetical protein
MGIELIIGGISALVGIVGAVGQANAASQAAAAQRESRDIGAAQQRINAQQSRRDRLREARQRAAMIEQSSQNVGTSRSSGEVGAIGALSTNLAGLFGQSLGESKAAQGMNAADQRASDAQLSGATIGAWTGAIQGALGGFQTVFDRKNQG